MPLSWRLYSLLSKWPFDSRDQAVANSPRLVMLLFRPECDDGIDFGGTARGNEAGNE